MAEGAWRIEGRVQGVGFRWNTVRTARGLGLAGRVWNRSDGAVEVHASGAREALEEFEGWLQQGPPAASVQRVKRIEPGPSAGGADFRVRR